MESIKDTLTDTGSYNNKQKPKSGQIFSTYVIILISIGYVLVLLLIMTIIIKCFCNKRKKSYKLESLMVLTTKTKEIEEVTDI